MFTLDKISSHLAYQEKSHCVFEQLGRCSMNREFGIVCREHAKQVFGIALANEVLVTQTGESRHHAVVATESRRTFLPFPWKIPFLNSGEPDLSKKVCLQRDVMDHEIKDYVHQIEATLSNPSNLIFNVESALMSLLSDGTVYNQAMPQASYNFHVFTNQNIRSYLQKRWKKCTVTVKHTHTSGTPSVTTVKHVEYPVDRLPVFYQIMLMYLTMSKNTLDTATNSDATVNSRLFNPNIILNQDRYRFEYCNYQEPSQLFLSRGNATSATPLVLAGVQEHQYNIELFKQGTYYSFSLLDSIEVCPAPAN